MGDFFNLLFSTLHDSTIILYTSIFIISSILGFKCQKKEWYGTQKINRIIFFLLFLFLCVFYAFNDVGIDTQHYRYYFDIYKDTISLDDGYGSVERLYQLLNIGLHYLISDSFWAVAIIRTLQLALFFYALYLLRDKTIIGFSIMAYVAFFYFDAFNLLRSSLAGSLSLLSFAYIHKRNNILGFVTALLAMGFHTSAILLVLTIGLYFLCYETILAKFQKATFILAIILFIIILVVGIDYINILLSNDFNGGRYENYTTSSNSIGLFILLKYFPAIIVFYLLKVNKSNLSNHYWLNLNFVWLIVGFAIALLAYNIGILTRVAIYFSTPFLFLIPFFCIQLLYKKSSNYKLIRLLFIVYFTYMYVGTMGGLYNISGLGPFKFF